MKNLFLVLPLLGLLSACSHTINFRANHFVTPIVGEETWSGHVAAVATSSTAVTVVNDFTTNPPLRTNVEVNKDLDAADLLLLNNIGVDASLSPLKSLDVFLESSVLGLRWQFLNHGNTSETWVAALQGGYGTRSKSTSQTGNGGVISDATSDVKTTQAGIGVGYKTASVVPYISYLHKTHKITTTVTNNATKFGPYDDSGVHDTFSVGLTTHKKGFMGAIEYSMINIKWDRADSAYQNAIGGKMGFTW